MKNAIGEYIELSDKEKLKIWQNAIFIFDTNVFLNLYRYSKKTRISMLEAMESLNDRIWMPYQVAKEFMKNRADVIYETIEQYNKLDKQKEEFVKTLAQSLRLKEDDSEIVAINKSISEWIDDNRKENVVVEEISKDAILEKLLQLYDGKVGAKETESELEDLRKDGQKRYIQKTPPGYKDSNKAISEDDNNAYGDYIIWSEILEYAKITGRDIIFVTHDQKEDWWNIVKGRTIGPRIELRKEFAEKTGRQFHMYTMNSFIEQFNDSKNDNFERIVNEMNALQKQLKLRVKKDEMQDNVSSSDYEDIKNIIQAQKHVYLNNYAELEDKLENNLYNKYLENNARNREDVDLYE